MDRKLSASHQERILRYESHEDFIQTCLNEGIIPKGFSLKWSLQLDTDTDIQEKCEKVKKDASLKLMSLAVEACKRKINTERAMISEKDLLEYDNAVKEDIDRMKQVLADKKREKLQKVRYFNSKQNIECELKESQDVQKLKNTVCEQNNKELLRNRFIVQKIKPDGNCFYRALEKSMNELLMKHSQIRKEIVEHMRSEKDVYSKYVDGDYETHLSEQSKNDGRISSWATEAEIFAAATLFNVIIRVFNIDDNGVHEHVFKPKMVGMTECTKNIYMKLERNHFESLVENYNNKKRKHNCTDDANINTGKAKGFDWFDMSNTDNNTDMINESLKLTLEEQNATMYETQPIRKTKKTALEDNLEKRDQAKKPKKKENSIITNLSSRKLSESEISLLSKGFSFVPTRKKIDIAKIHSDLAEWERRMRLKEYFYGREREQDREEIKPWEKKESFFTPMPGRDMWLDTYIEEVKRDIINNIKTNITSNLTKKEKEAMTDLLNDSDIVIRPADKGSGIVLIDTKDYIEKLESEMNESQSYEKTKEGSHLEAHKKVKQITSKMFKDGLITKELKEYLNPQIAECGKLKGNPKIHKDGIPYRTIVNGIGTVTERMAETAEKELNEFVENTPSYIKDTSDFLRKLTEIETPLPENAILFCFDVVQLYPSVPKKEGMEACREALESRIKKNIPTDAVMKMIETVLENNIFTFNGKEYVQTEGVAIGSKLGKNFACSYMRRWDRSLLQYNKTPIFYKRFIDDGFGIWTHGEEELIKFKEHANQIHSNIKVELRWNKTKLEFLDTNVIMKNRLITTELYTKPTDKHLYVNSKSSHPVHVKRAIPYGMALRLKRICSDDGSYAEHRQHLKTQLRRRGYSGKFIEGELKKVDKIDRKDVLKEQIKKPASDRVPLVLTYSRQLPNIHAVIKRYLPTLYQSERMTDIFQEPPLVAYRKDRSLG